MSNQQPAAPASPPAAAAPITPPPAAGAPPSGANTLNTMLGVLYTAARAVLAIDTRAELPARLGALLKTAYDLLRDGQLAILEVQADIAANKPVTIPAAVVPVLPEWPTTPAAAPSLMEDVGGMLQPWAGLLVNELPGNTPGEKALKLWAANILNQWQTLTTDIQNVVNGSRAG